MIKNTLKNIYAIEGLLEFYGMDGRLCSQVLVEEFPSLYRASTTMSLLNGINTEIATMDFFMKFSLFDRYF